MKEISVIEVNTLWKRKDLDRIIRNYSVYLEPDKYKGFILSSLGRITSPGYIRRLKYDFDRSLDSIGEGKWTRICDSRNRIAENFHLLNKGQKTVVALYLGYADGYLKQKGIPNPANTRDKAFSRMLKYLTAQQGEGSIVLFTTRQVAERLGISDARVRKLIYEGRIKATKVGGQNLVREEDAHYERKREFPKKRKVKEEPGIQEQLPLF